MASLYGVVEKAAEIIEKDYTPTTPSDNSGSQQNHSAPSDNSANGANRATSLVSTWTLGLVSTFIVAVLF